LTEQLDSQVYYVDEAGDSTIFSSKGKILIDTEGCSRFFMLGLLEIGDLTSLETSLEALRTDLLADPYFKGVPSMQPEAMKTAMAFHAKDDLPEVRREVFNLLRARNDLRFFAVASDKYSTLDYIISRQSHDSGYRYHPDEAYDFLVRRLFKQRLREFQEYKVVFAQRGNKKRNKALKTQLEIAQLRDENDVDHLARLDVSSGVPKNFAGLQVVDYFLWALQRLYERHEDRYIISLWPQCKLIVDIHDNRRYKYGEYYSKRNPLTWEKIEGRM
jgi:hypothetical protein